MECMLVIKRKFRIYDGNELEVPTDTFELETECVCGDVKSPRIEVSELMNKIYIYGFEELLEPNDEIISFEIAERDEEVGDHIAVYIESIELNGRKVFDINECRNLLKCK